MCQGTRRNIGPFGYVSFDDFFSEASDPKRVEWEMRLANAFLALSECAGIIIRAPIANDDNKLVGANATLLRDIPTRQKEESGAKREPGDEA